MKPVDNEKFCVLCPVEGCDVKMMRLMDQVDGKWVVWALTESDRQEQQQQLLESHSQGRHS